MMSKKNIFFIIPLILLPLYLSSCANVQGIERGFLSKKIMQLDPHPEESVFQEEVHSYREGAVGGNEAVGGGCGCN